MAATLTQALSEQLASFAVDFDLRASPSRDILLQKAKMHILDSMGVALASTTMDDAYAQKLLRVVQGFRGAPVSTVIGLGGALGNEPCVTATIRLIDQK